LNSNNRVHIQHYPLLRIDGLGLGDEFAVDSGQAAEVLLLGQHLGLERLQAGSQRRATIPSLLLFRTNMRARASTSGKGVTKGPGVNVWSAGLAKEFMFHERARLRWEMTATNFFNHPNWANPNTDITNTTAVGVIQSDGGVTSGSVGDRAGARAFRMGLRLQF
jgi:hypothetical protein